MAAILVDYENVHGACGLKGVQYLKPTDILCIFYSSCCNTVVAEDMELILKSKCDFRIHKLRKTGKNGLDFYIASECGVLSKSGVREIAIISRDKGFAAVKDYFETSEYANKIMIVTAPSIEKGLGLLSAKDDRERRTMIASNAKPCDISVEYAKYSERNAIKKKVSDALVGMGYESMVDKVFSYIEVNNEASPKQKYTRALHEFGRKDGTVIYGFLKKGDVKIWTCGR